MSHYNIAIGSDHGGYELKTAILEHLKKRDPFLDMYTCRVVDFGCHNTESVDYPDYARAVCNTINASNDVGILVCGTGIGISIAANRHSHIRAGLCHNTETAKLTRQHNNANVLCLGGRITSVDDAIKIVDTFLTTEFEGGRHQKRLDKL
jgi:ribose 5-phosphate isomerase B